MSEADELDSQVARDTPMRVHASGEDDAARQEGPPSVLEILQQEFADALVGHRACQWEAGDVAERALKACRTRKERSAVCRLLGSLGHCSEQYVKQLAQVAATFPKPLRKPDIAWSLYRACMQAVGRYQSPWDAPGLLEVALQNDWHCRDVNQLGKGEQEPASTLRATCGDCGAKVSVSIVGMGGIMLPCPVCVATAFEDTTNGLPTATLGTLS